MSKNLKNYINRLSLYVWDIECLARILDHLLQGFDTDLKSTDKTTLSFILIKNINKLKKEIILLQNYIKK